MEWLKLAALLAPSLLADGEWTLVNVPGPWEKQAAGHFATHDGFAWYRAFVRVTDDMVDNPRPLWPESVTLTVTGVGDAHEVFLNGVKLGGAGTFPPSHSSGKDVVRRYKVRRGILKQGAYNCVAFRVYNASGDGGFLGPAPVLAGYELEWVLEGSWEFRPGDDLSWAAEARAEKPASAAYETPREALTPLEPPSEVFPGTKLAPTEALAHMKTQEDLEVELVLSEPQVGQPIYLSWDERARLWVTEYRQYPYPAGVKMVSRNKYYRAVYDRAPEPPPHGARGADRVTIHEDTDGDGRLDLHKTFVEGLNLATSALRGHGGVWIICSPHLLFYPDADGDDVPDGDPVVRLGGLGLEDSHSLNNSLRWGPDGWLYGVQGCNLVSHVRTSGGQGGSWLPGEVYLEGPGIWRYRLTAPLYEVFAEGGGNAFGLELDGAGRIFSGHNGSETRGFHYVQGAYFEKGTEVKFGPVSNPYAFGTLPGMATGPISRFTHTFVRYEGGTLPERYRDRLFLVDPLAQKVLVSSIEARGSSFGTKDLFPALTTDDPAFRPVEIKVGPDGAVYVADFCEEHIAHGQHYQGQVDPDSGRIWRLRARGDRRPPPAAPSQRSSPELVELLDAPGTWHRETALRLLAERQDLSIEPLLLERFRGPPGPGALNALWALIQLGRFDESLALQALGHSVAPVRLWAIRVVGDGRVTSPRLAERLRDLARYETDAEVRCQLAATARRLPSGQALPILRELLVHDQDAEDPYQPLMIWWALEAHVGSARREVLDLLDPPAIWKRPLAALLPGRLARRLASGGSREALLGCARLFRQAPDRSAVDAVLAGLELAFQGRSAPAFPSELLEAMEARGAEGSLALRLRRRLPGAAEEGLRIVGDESAPLPARLEAAQLFGEVPHSLAVPSLLTLARARETPPTLRFAALASLGRYETGDIASTLLAARAQLEPEVRSAADGLLTSRATWARMLVKAVREGGIEPTSVSRDTVRKLELRPEEDLRDQVRAIWGEVLPSSPDVTRREVDRVLGALEGGEGSPYAGKASFTRLCGRCHTLFREGGRVGPDLSPYNRQDTKSLVLHIVSPGAEVREGFETYVATVSDGRIVSGFLVDRDEVVVTLRGQDGQTVTLEKKELLSFERSGVSVMPEGLLEGLSDQNLRDLFSYLRVSQPMTP